MNYEDALLLCKTYNNFNFYKTEYKIDDYKIVSFSYFKVDEQMLNLPIKSRPDLNGYDMRGLTFVFNSDGTLFKRFFMLKKFFNLNQTYNDSYEILKNKNIKYVLPKEDGSLIAYMYLPNKKVFAKTIMGFSNDHVNYAMQRYHNDKNIKDFVDNSLFKDNAVPLFEYVSYKNRIVLKYGLSDLIFLGLRYFSGEYFSSPEVHILNDNISRVTPRNFKSLDEILENCKTQENIEGYVIIFEDGQITKCKTKWYFNLHYVRTESSFREDYICKMYLSDTLDDMMQNISRDYNADVYEFVSTISRALNNWSNHIENKVNELENIYLNYESKIDFYKIYSKYPYFGLFSNKLISDDKYKLQKVAYMLYHTRKLKLARNIIDKWKNEDISII